VTPEPIRLAVPEHSIEETSDDLRRSVLDHPRGTTVVLDCARIGHVDALGAARLLRVIAEGRAAGIDVRLTGLGDDLRRLLAEVDPAIFEPGPPARRRRALEAIGETALETADAAAAIGTLLAETMAGLAVPFGRRGIKWNRTLHQLALIGAQGVAIVVFISFLIGVVLALNGAAQLRQFGAAIFIANLVGISMTREMGPLMTAVIVSGRTGSAIAAEIGSMVVSEEVDAMRTMAIDPVRFLVVPRVVALVLALPLLTALSNAAGIFGGWVVGVMTLDLGSHAYLTQTVQALLISDVVVGLVKSVVFAVVIGAVGAYRGFAVRGGPEAVGEATTSAVVTSIILCIIANAGFTAFFYFTG
jgi:phospholipid/cholesterol/gamma-HCH transport system permease protein